MKTERQPDALGHEKTKSYLIGSALSVILTLGAYWIVADQWLSGWALYASVALLGLIQALVQLVLFLNVGREPKPRWNLVVFLFTVMVTLILVFGSIWIMNNLNYNLMES